MTFLPDVNVWIALAVAEHTHHAAAVEWFDSISGQRLAFCRVTQTGFLRLLTNTLVMKGDELTPVEAWKVLDAIYGGVNPIFAAEPEYLEQAWRGFTEARGAGPNLWTDAYLAAFAEARGYTVVTFDRGMAGFRGTAVKVLRG